MNDTAQDTRNRLDSWKAIAAYLDRDERTVQRWERELGLPIRRVPGGRGRSVFAFPSEIDVWLQTRQGLEIDAPAPVADTPPRPRLSRMWPAGVAALLAVAATLVWWLRPSTMAANELRLESTTDGVTAFDAKGARRWEYTFPPAYSTLLAEDTTDPSKIAAGGRPAVYVATAFRIRRADSTQENGALTELDLNGRPQRSFSFTDSVTFDGTSYGPPWVITDFAIQETGGRRRIAIAAHHAVWSASLVTVLDEQLQRHGTFVHAGWIEQVQWQASNRLVIGGYSNAHDGGMVALLDPTAPDGIDGQGPEPAASPYFCQTCPTRAPVRMAVMPRTELNRVTASRFNRARIQVTPQGIMARTIEVPQPVAGLDAIEALYEFTPSLDLVRAAFGDHYHDFAHGLELQGRMRLAHAPVPTADRPQEIQVWAPSTGWQTLKIR